MSKTPYVVPVAGSDDFMVRRYIKEWTTHLESQGYKTTQCLPGELGEELSAAGLSDAKRHFVVESPDVKEDGDTLFPPMDGIVVTLVFGDKLPKKWEELLKPHKVTTFDDVPPHKQGDRALAFLAQEVRRQGLELAPELQKALVSKVGTDRGVLSFEVWKAGLLASPSKVITLETLAGSIAPMLDAEIEPFVEALKRKNDQKIFRALAHISDTAPADPTIKLCRYVLEMFVPILQACSCLGLGMADEDAAQACKTNPWVYRNKVKPVAQHLGEDRCVALVNVFADTERDVKLGAQKPLMLLESRLLIWCLK